MGFDHTGGRHRRPTGKRQRQPRAQPMRQAQRHALQCQGAPLLQEQRIGHPVGGAEAGHSGRAVGRRMQPQEVMQRPRQGQCGRLSQQAPPQARGSHQHCYLGQLLPAQHHLPPHATKRRVAGGRQALAGNHPDIEAALLLHGQLAVAGTQRAEIGGGRVGHAQCLRPHGAFPCAGVAGSVSPSGQPQARCVPTGPTPPAAPAGPWPPRPLPRR